MHLSMIRVYAINSITTQDNEMFGDFKEWIQSLKKFSTLISESGEMQRILFLKSKGNYQRALIPCLPKSETKPQMSDNERQIEFLPVFFIRQCFILQSFQIEKTPSSIHDIVHQCFII